MRLTPNAVGLGLILIMAIAMLVWSPIQLMPQAKADELNPVEQALAVASEREAMRALAQPEVRAAVSAARHRKN